MITHTIDSYQIQSKKQDKVKVTNLKKIAKYSHFGFLPKIFTWDTPSGVAW